ncbi:MAG: ROK family transcriptional regulator [Gammaproteobacteria bacterium]|nr:ROK family transcriptional regulator [Gammaproteobacteria bacterium]
MTRGHPIVGGREEHGRISERGRRSRQSVLAQILLSGPISRTTIADRVGLTAGAVSRVARPLINEGLVRELPEKLPDGPVRPGRRTIRLDIDPQGGQVLGIGIDPSFLTVTLADIKNSTIATSGVELDTVEEPDLVIRRVARESRRLIGAHLDDRRRLIGGVLTIAGAVDPVRGDLLDSPHLGWGRFPLRARLADVLDLPVRVRSMAAAIAQAETLFGAARGFNNVLTLVCGLGIDAIVILAGRLVDREGFPGGGIGEMEVTGENGIVSTLNQLGGGLGMLRCLHGEVMTPSRSPSSSVAQALRDAVERDQADDPMVRALMAQAGREFGRVVVQLARLFVPDVILLAGPLSEAPGYVDAARQVVAGGIAPRRAEVITGILAGSSSERSVSCAMAIHEYLLGGALNLDRPHLRLG